MKFVLAGAIFLIATSILWKFFRTHPVYRYIPLATLVIALGLLLQTSLVIVDQDKVGHLNRVYLAEPLPQGHIIARMGELGPQARILGPGLYFQPLLRIFYTVEQRPLLEVTDGHLAVLVARDGEPLTEGQYVARGWSTENLPKMLDAAHFLEHGGQRGIQLTVLPPGRYRFNQYLFQAQTIPALDVVAGEVAVIKSNAREREDCPPASTSPSGPELAAPIVPRGCVGVWDTPLMPGRYYLNLRAYQPTKIPTRVQTWVMKGGFLTREIALTVADDGRITQSSESKTVEVPGYAVDRAVIATIEGWRVPIELRMLVQVNPGDAPLVVSAVGDLKAVESKIATPGIRSVVRNITGQSERKVLDLIERREDLEALVEQSMATELAKAGVTLREIRFGDPVIPPELLVAREREQLAQQLEKTYQQEQLAQRERAAVERARAQADEQHRLVAAEIDVKVAEQTKQRLHLEGEGEKLRLTEIARGQEAQASVLGKENAKELAMLKEILNAAVANPKIVKVPTVAVTGPGSGLEGAAAVLGASNIVNWGSTATPPERERSSVTAESEPSTETN
jgi:regulator of protease activity HflC (stomatin/prohibitin superfamily)